MEKDVCTLARLGMSWHVLGLLACFAWLTWVTDWLIDRSIDWLIDWLIRWLIDWFVDWLIDWVVDWLLLFWLIGWLINWLLLFWLIWSLDWLTKTHTYPQLRTHATQLRTAPNFTIGPFGPTKLTASSHLVDPSWKSVIVHAYHIPRTRYRVNNQTPRKQKRSGWDDGGQQCKRQYKILLEYYTGSAQYAAIFIFSSPINACRKRLGGELMCCLSQKSRWTKTPSTSQP